MSSTASVDPSGRTRLVVAAIAFASLLGTLMQSLIVPFVPQLPALLGAPASTTAWLVTATLLSGTVASVLFGRLGDQFGKRRMMLIALSGLLAGSLLAVFSTSIAVLIVARALQGLAMAMIPLGVSALRDVLRGDAMVRGIALISAMASIGGTLGFAASAIAAEFIGLTGLFIASAVLAALALAGVALMVPSSEVRKGERVDIVGGVVLTVGLVGLLVAITSGNGWGWASPATLGLLIGSVLVLVGWGVHQLRASAPLIDLRTTARRPVLFTNLASLVSGFAMYGIILALPQIIQLPAETGFTLGLSIVVAGLCVAPGGFLALLVPSVAARITERRGPKLTMVIGAAAIAAGYVVILFAHTQIWTVIISSALISVGVSFCFGAAPALILQHVPRSESGQAVGINNLARSLGTAASSAVTAAVLSTVLIGSGFGVGELPSEGAFVTVFLIGIAAAAVIVVLIALVPRRGGTPLDELGAAQPQRPAGGAR